MRKKYSVLLVLLVLVGLYFGAKVYLTGLCRKEADATIARLAPYAAVRYGGISFNVFTMHTTLSDVTIATPGASESLRVQELVVNDVDRHAQFPQYLSVTLKGIAVDLREGSELAENFKKLGYKDKIFYDVMWIISMITKNENCSSKNWPCKPRMSDGWPWNFTWAISVSIRPSC